MFFTLLDQDKTYVEAKVRGAAFAKNRDAMCFTVLYFQTQEPKPFRAAVGFSSRDLGWTFGSFPTDSLPNTFYLEYPDTNDIKNVSKSRLKRFELVEVTKLPIPSYREKNKNKQKGN